MKVNKQNLCALQCSKGWTGNQFARAAGMYPAQISMIKRRGTASPKSVYALAQALGVPVETILQTEEGSE